MPRAPEEHVRAVAERLEARRVVREVVAAVGLVELAALSTSKRRRRQTGAGKEAEAGRTADVLRSRMHWTFENDAAAAG